MSTNSGSMRIVDYGVEGSMDAFLCWGWVQELREAHTAATGVRVPDADFVWRWSRSADAPRYAFKVKMRPAYQNITATVETAPGEVQTVTDVYHAFRRWAETNGLTDGNPVYVWVEPAPGATEPEARTFEHTELPAAEPASVPASEEVPAAIVPDTNIHSIRIVYEEEECDNCSGTGTSSCGSCETGKVECTRCGAETMDCDDCDGTGEGTCGECDGGHVEGRWHWEPKVGPTDPHPRQYTLGCLHGVADLLGIDAGSVESGDAYDVQFTTVEPGTDSNEDEDWFVLTVGDDGSIGGYFNDSIRRMLLELGMRQEGVVSRLWVRAVSV